MFIASAPVLLLLPASDLPYLGASNYASVIEYIRWVVNEPPERRYIATNFLHLTISYKMFTNGQCYWRTF